MAGSSALSIFPYGGAGDASDSQSAKSATSLSWYIWWLDRQFQNLPQSITGRFSEFSMHGFMVAFVETAKYAKAEASSFSIDDIGKHLIDLHLLNPQDNDNGLEATRPLIFAILGWQTMLYVPSFGTCPPEQLALDDVLDGYTGQAFTVLKQNQALARRSLPDFLVGFGVMLPTENICLIEDNDGRQAFDKLATISPERFNANLLRSIARIRIRWVDVLAPHLEYDQATNTLFLFRYPSFCSANFPSSGDHAKGVIHSFACHDGSLEYWASENDVTRLLHEVLLSYRLLFGQNRAARQLFRSMDPFADIPVEGQDSLLPLLCGSNSFDCSSLSIPERELYRLSRDFPILRGKIAILHQHLSNVKPRGWKELWRDRRDTAQWYTFWAVIILGGSGVLLTLVQVALQAAQLARS